MKTIIYILIGMLILFSLSQLWAQSQVNGIEMYPYKVIRMVNDVEIRRYEKANFIYATVDAKTYKEGSSQGFNTLAGYIFGGNASGQKIAMTSPVEMKMDEEVIMKFLVPAEYDLNELPTPDNAEVRFMTEDERTLAAITFDGFANDEKILEYKERLFSALEEHGLTHTGQWSFMGYDPPFKLFGRRNEVVVEMM